MPSNFAHMRSTIPRVSLALYPSAVAGSLFPVSNQLNGNWAAGYTTVASEQEAPQGMYWAKIPRWEELPVDTFLSHSWRVIWIYIRRKA